MSRSFVATPPGFIIGSNNCQIVPGNNPADVRKGSRYYYAAHILRGANLFTTFEFESYALITVHAIYLVCPYDFIPRNLAAEIHAV